VSRLRLPFVDTALTGATQLTTALLAPVSGATKGVHRSMGAGRRAVRRHGIASPRYADGIFHNTLPLQVTDATDNAPLLLDWLRRDDRGRPPGPVPVEPPTLPETAAPLAATWLGHATVLLEVDGRWVLTDPVWSDRVSPSANVGPRRSHPVPMPLEELPRLSAVLISHDHYDHLDTATVDALVRSQDVVFVVPLGIGAHLRRWGVPAHRFRELDWDDQVEVDGLTFTCTEARHFSGRGLSRNNTLWASWVVTGPHHRVLFGGDTGYTPAFGGIGASYGPFDLTLLPIGAYDPRWPDVHLDPEEAVRVHREAGGAVLLPIHWLTFDLAFHAWAEPVERLLTEASVHGVPVATPPPGRRFEVEPAASDGLPRDDWWTAVRRAAGSVRDRT
jgi:L-ascorbate metabolism protein UlaG (beta-lactamase superfamily)